MIVFICRYVDLVTAPHYSLYNTIMKVFFIASSVYTLYLIKVKFRCVLACHRHRGGGGQLTGRAAAEPRSPSRPKALKPPAPEADLKSSPLSFVSDG